MKIVFIICTLLPLIFIFPSPPSEGSEKIMSKTDALEAELNSLKRDSVGIPSEEFDKASGWIQDVRQHLGSGNEDQARITLQRASFQIELLKALAEEGRIKEEKEKLNRLLRKIRNQTEEIKGVNSEVLQEINTLEQE